MATWGDRLAFWGGFATGALAAYQYSYPIIQHSILYLSSADWAKQAITNLPLTQPVVARFVAGDTLGDAIEATRVLNGQRMRVSLDLLGESVRYSHETIAARDQILAALDRIAADGVDANVSVKLSQLGLKIDRELAYANMAAILTTARRHDNWVRIDMEESAVTDATLDIYYRLRAAGFDNVGVVIQSYLYRSENDIKKLVEAGARVRLCKGAYAEPTDVAFPVKASTDANFVNLMQRLLSATALDNGVWPAIATHDSKMIQATIDYARQHDIPPDRFEFQMLYGVRRELQTHLIQQGYKVRIYVPFGEAWYPYLMRRLAERPANLQFFLANL